MNDREAPKCPWCAEILYYKHKRILKPVLAPLTPEQAVLDELPFEFVAIQPAFCPVCGRPLTDQARAAHKVTCFGNPQDCGNSVQKIEGDYCRFFNMPCEEMRKHPSCDGLYTKYNVIKADTGEPVNDCFVLRPDRDPASVSALRTYAKTTENKELAANIIKWVGVPEKQVEPLRTPIEISDVTWFGVPYFAEYKGVDKLFLYVTGDGIQANFAAARELGWDGENLGEYFEWEKVHGKLQVRLWEAKHSPPTDEERAAVPWEEAGNGTEGK